MPIMAVGRAVANEIGGMRRGFHAAVATTCRIGTAFFVGIVRLLSRAGLTGNGHAQEPYSQMSANLKRSSTI
jgi:hypothetical protein